MQVESAKYVFRSWVVPLWIHRLLGASSMRPRHSGCVPCTHHALIYLLISQVYLLFFFFFFLLLLFLNRLRTNLGCIVVIVIYWLIDFLTFDTVWSGNVIVRLSLSLKLINFGFIRLIWLLWLNSILYRALIYRGRTKAHRKWPFLSTIYALMLLISTFKFFKNLIDVLIVYRSHFLFLFVSFDLLYNHDVLQYDFTFQITTESMLEALRCIDTRLILF